MVLTIALVAIAALGALLAYAARRPDSFRVERSIRIDAPAERIYPLVADFHAWTRWSPWEGLDPAMQRTYGGATAGAGATYAWSGTGKVGAGKMAIAQAQAPTELRIQLDFIRPFASRNTTTFTFTPVPADGATQVQWTMSGPSPFISKLMGVFMNLDRMIGRDFEKGLQGLRAAAEGGGA